MTGPLELRDPLTGVYSRAFLQVRLRAETGRSRRYGLTFSLLIFDLDNAPDGPLNLWRISLDR